MVVADDQRDRGLSRQRHGELLGRALDRRGVRRDLPDALVKREVDATGDSGGEHERSDSEPHGDLSDQAQA